jgi:uncharacterized protein with FMN-binding domain
VNNDRPVRASGVLGAVAVGAALLAAKSQLGAPAPELPKPAAARPTATTAPAAPVTSLVPAPVQTQSQGVDAPAPVAVPPTAPAPTGPRTLEGDLISTEFGPMQVALVVADGRITEVQHLAVPEADQESIEINRVAIPQLREQVLAAQGADIQGVSGATYTAQAYALSVQSALDRA